MPNKQPILVAVDFSPHAQAALVWALEYGRLLQAPVTVLHVVHDPAETPGYYTPKDAGDSLRPPEHVAADMMDEFFQLGMEARPDLVRPEHYESQLVSGIPATRIVEVADSIQAQLIVVGCQGRSALKRVMLGSKALRVIQLSTLPVTVVKSQGFSGAGD